MIFAVHNDIIDELIVTTTHKTQQTMQLYSPTKMVEYKGVI
jgi:hypothetical protein